MNQFFRKHHLFISIILSLLLITVIFTSIVVFGSTIFAVVFSLLLLYFGDKFRFFRAHILLTKEESKELFISLSIILVILPIVLLTGSLIVNGWAPVNELFLFLKSIYYFCLIFLYPLLFLLLFLPLYILILKDRRSAGGRYDYMEAAIYINKRLSEKIASKIDQETIVKILQSKLKYEKDRNFLNLIKDDVKCNCSKEDLIKIFLLEEKYLKEIY